MVILQTITLSSRLYEEKALACTRTPERLSRGAVTSHVKPLRDPIPLHRISNEMIQRTRCYFHEETQDASSITEASTPSAEDGDRNGP